jgi:hypothetical protein
MRSLIFLGCGESNVNYIACAVSSTEFTNKTRFFRGSARVAQSYPVCLTHLRRSRREPENYRVRSIFADRQAPWQRKPDGLRLHSCDICHWSLQLRDHPNFIECRLMASGNEHWQIPKTLTRPPIVRAEKLLIGRKGAEHARKYRQMLWGVLRVPSFSACSAFSAEQLQPD